MKKAKNIKFLVLILTLALVISSMVLVVASANTEDAPSIVAVNLSLEGDNRIAIAVDASTASENVKVVASADGVAAQEFGYYAKETINFDGASKECYLFLTPYIGQKDIAKVYSFKAVDGEKESEVATMSVAEYFYLRLFRDGVVDATEGKALAQKTLYIANLNAGAAAEDLFYNFDEDDTNNIAVLANAYNIALIPGTAPVVYKNNTTTVTLPAYAGTIPEGKVFAGYSVTKYDANYAATVTTANAGEQITIDANTVVGATFKDEFNFGTGMYFSGDYAGERFLYTTLTENNNLQLDGIVHWQTKIGDTAEAIDGRLVYTRTQNDPSNGTYIRWNCTSVPTNINAPKLIFETDFMFDGLTATSISAHNLLIQANGINQQISTSVENVEDYALERNTMTVGKLTLTAGNWYNIRFELDYTAGTIEYFLDNVSAGTDSINTANTINSNRILWYYLAKSTAGQMSYDNTFIGWVDMNPSVEIPVEGGEFFNSEIAGTRIDGDNLLSSAADVSVSDSLTMVDGDLVFSRNEGVTDLTSYKFAHGCSAEGIETPVLVFEADMKLSNLAPNGKIVSNLTFAHDGKEAVVSIDFWNTALYIKGYATLVVGETYNYRFEVDFANNKVNLFVDGVFAGSQAITFQTPGGTDVKDNYVKICISQHATTTEIAVDNVYMGIIEEASATN